MTFAALMGFAIGGSFMSALNYEFPEEQYIEQSNDTAKQKSEQDKIPKTFRQRFSIIWGRTWEDPVAFYTFVLSIFTGLLAAVSATQIGFLIRADRTARTAAEAAKSQAQIAERALIAAERAWISIDPALIAATDLRLYSSPWGSPSID